VVEIIASKVGAPNRYWLSFVVTSHAKSSIKHWFNTQEKGNLIKEGKNLINKHLKRLGLKGLGPDLSQLKHYLGKKLNVREREEILEKIGNGSVEAISVVKKIVSPDVLASKEVDQKTKNEALAENVNLGSQSDILITGEGGYKTQIATCCKPTVEDRIIGYITRGRGITIHKNKCKVVLRGHDSKRLIETSWAAKTKPTYKTVLEIKIRSRIGLLRDISDVYAQNDLSILGLQLSENLVIETIVESLKVLDRLIQQLKAIPDVYGVKELRK